MPQASEELRARWSSDSAAWKQLAPNFGDRSGMILRKPGYTPTDDDLTAIDYLCDEWDYGYDPAAEFYPTHHKPVALAELPWVAYLVPDNEEGREAMLFFSLYEACTYCDDDEHPASLTLHAEATRLVADLRDENERLREALLEGARRVEALKRECGMDPESPIAIQNGRYMSVSYFLRAALKEKSA